MTEENDTSTKLSKLVESSQFGDLSVDLERLSPLNKK